MMKYVSKKAFDVLLRGWSLEIIGVDELTQAPMVGVELVHPYWAAFERKHGSEDLSAVIIRTGSSKAFRERAAATRMTLQ